MFLVVSSGVCLGVPAFISSPCRCLAVTWRIFFMVLTVSSGPWWNVGLSSRSRKDWSSSIRFKLQVWWNDLLSQLFWKLFLIAAQLEHHHGFINTSQLKHRKDLYRVPKGFVRVRVRVRVRFRVRVTFFQLHFTPEKLSEIFNYDNIIIERLQNSDMDKTSTDKTITFLGVV